MYREIGNKQWVYQFQLQETEDPTKSGLNNKENLLCHISRTLIEVGWSRVGSETLFSVFLRMSGILSSLTRWLQQLQTASCKTVQRLDERHLFLLSEEWGKIFLEVVALCLIGHSYITRPCDDRSMHVCTMSFKTHQNFHYFSKWLNWSKYIPSKIVLIYFCRKIKVKIKLIFLFINISPNVYFLPIYALKELT